MEPLGGNSALVSAMRSAPFQGATRELSSCLCCCHGGPKRRRPCAAQSRGFARTWPCGRLDRGLLASQTVRYKVLLVPSKAACDTVVIVTWAKEQTGHREEFAFHSKFEGEPRQGWEQQSSSSLRKMVYFKRNRRQRPRHLNIRFSNNYL